MDTLIKFILGIVSVIALVFSFLALNRPDVAPVTQTPPYGSVTGPDLQSQYYIVGGLVTYKYHNALNGTASTSCVFQSPKEGTSTLVYGAIKVSSSTAAATIFEMGQSTGPDATTTLIGGKYALAASNQTTIVASSSPTGEALNFAPGTFFSIKQGGVQTGGIGGSCDATFVVN